MPKRKIIVTIATSADGFIARKDGAVDWLDRPRPKAEDYGMGEFFKSIDTILYGRKTYDTAVKFVEEGIEIPDDGSNIRNYVFSRRRPPKKVLPGFEFVKGPIKKFIGRLRAEKGKDIWMMGGGGIIASFLDEGEIDEFIISVIPVFIGEGIPLIAPSQRTVPLKLLSTKKYSDGVVSLHYAVGKKLGTKTRR
ncbi:MAG TPA: dihydrofolate reductase family protein [Pyrinomonadaceae bacterium]|nr:dihydrofolate reductase family protein [Pyrinomonadaceae bacterium]